MAINGDMTELYLVWRYIYLIVDALNLPGKQQVLDFILNNGLDDLRIGEV